MDDVWVDESFRYMMGVTKVDGWVVPMVAMKAVQRDVSVSMWVGELAGVMDASTGARKAV